MKFNEYEERIMYIYICKYTNFSLCCKKMDKNVTYIIEKSLILATSAFACLTDVREKVDIQAGAN